MKLNNKGWGLGVMIAFLCVFSLFFVEIAIQAYHLGIGNQISASAEEDEREYITKD